MNAICVFWSEELCYIYIIFSLFLTVCLIELLNKALEPWVWQFSRNNTHEIDAESVKTYRVSFIHKIFICLQTIYLSAGASFWLPGLILLIPYIIFLQVFNIDIANFIMLLLFYIFIFNFLLGVNVFSMIRPVKIVYYGNDTMHIYTLTHRLLIDLAKIKSARLVKPSRISILGNIYKIEVELHKKTTLFQLQSFAQEETIRELIEHITNRINDLHAKRSNKL